MDPDCCRITTALHLGAPIIIGGGPETIFGPITHIYRVYQRWYRQTPEPAQPTDRWPSDGVWDDGNPPPLLAVLVVPAREDVAAGEVGQRDAGKWWTNPGDWTAMHWNSENKRRKELTLIPPCPAGYAPFYSSRGRAPMWRGGGYWHNQEQCEGESRRLINIRCRQG